MKNPDIRKDKLEALEKRFKALGIRERDIEESFVHATGKGGQKVNKSSMCVYLKHVPTGIEVRCQKDRSQARNRFLARRLLADKIDTLINKKKSDEQKRIAKIRRQKRKRSKRAKEKMLAAKKRRSAKKGLRKAPEVEE